MTIDLGNLSNVQNTFDVVTYANSVSEGILFTGLMVVLFVILLLIFKRYTFERGFLAASWIMFLISVIVWFLKLIPIGVPITFLVSAVLTFLYMILTDTD